MSDLIRRSDVIGIFDKEFTRNLNGIDLDIFIAAMTTKVKLLEGVDNSAKSLCEITLNGCDDDTYFVMELTEQEYQFLLRVSEKANETSTYGCMPRLYVEKLVQYQSKESDT